jgi:hypothetical protein
MEAQALGLDPYAPATRLSLGIPDFLFVNTPPIASWLLGLPAGTPLRSHFGLLLSLATISAVVAIPLVLGMLFFGPQPAALALACGAFLVMFAGCGISSIGAANLGTTLHALVIVAAAPGFRSGQWRWLILSVAFAALFKPLYLAYLILPAAADGWSWRAFLAGAAVAAVVAASYAASAWLMPDAFAGWIANLRGAVVTQGDGGMNLLGARILRDAGGIAYVAQAIVMICILMAALMTPTGPERWAALLIAVQFFNPRLMAYDIAVAAVPMAFLARRLLPASWPPLMRLAITVATLVAVQFTAYNDSLVHAALLFPIMSLVILAANIRKRAST